MLVREVIQRIQSLYSRGVQSDDSRLSDRHIYNKMITIRSKLLSQDINKKQKVSQWNYQTIPCVELVVVPRHECDCLPPIGCNIYKSKYKLPETLTGLTHHIIQSVTSIDGSIIYSESSWKENKYKSGNKYTSFKPDFYIRNGYLYITDKGGPKIISVTGLFEDPLTASEYENYCNQNCTDCEDCESPLDKEFPLDLDKIDTLVEMCINELLVVFGNSIEDMTNNTRDEQNNVK